MFLNKKASRVFLFLKKTLDHLFEIFILLYFTNPIEISNSTRLG